MKHKDGRTILFRTTAMVVVLAACGCLSQTSGKTLSVADFGAVPNDGGNDLDAFRKAAEVVRRTPGSTMLIPPGRYLLRDETAVQALDEIRSGKYGHDSQRITFVPYAPYVKAIDLTGAEGVTVDGRGAILEYEGIMEGITLAACRRVTLRGLTLDCAKGRHSEGRITAVRPGSFDAAFDPVLYPVFANMAVPRMQFWDEKENRYSPTHYYSVGSERVAPQTLRFHVNSPLPAGNTVTMSHLFFSRPAIAVLDSSDIRIEQVVVYGGGGNAVGGERVRNLTMFQLQVVPRPGQRHSTNVDATHFNNCTGLLRLDSCRIGGQEDDSINIHCYYHTLTRRIDDFTCEAKLRTSYGTHLNRLDRFSPGERVELVETDSGRVVRSYGVKECRPDEKAMKNILVLDDKLPENIGRFYITPADRYPKVELVNNAIFSNRARAFLVKSRDILIENNTFDGSTSTAIQCGAETSWWESGPVQKVVIRNNRFTHCGIGNEGRHGASAISVELDAPNRNFQVNHDVLIEGNVADCENTPHAIYVGNTDGVVVRNNRAIHCRNEAVRIENCTNVANDNNTKVAPE